jgi:SAM-dependent methyltransferase
MPAPTTLTPSPPERRGHDHPWWKERLYQRYVSTGQAAGDWRATSSFTLRQYPQFVALVREHLTIDRSARIVDLGCGHGALVFCLRALGFSNVSGIDISAEQIDLGRRLGVTDISRDDIFHYLAGEHCTLDAALMLDVLEHMDKPGVIHLLDLVRRALKPGGCLILHVPNAEGLFGMRVRYGDFTHETCFTQRSMTQVLISCGFSRVKVFEQRPFVHGLRSFVRYLLWRSLMMPLRLLLLAETGSARCVLSQNMIVVAHK